MKKLICLLLIFIITISSVSTLADEQPIEVLVDSEFLIFDDQPPVMINDRVLVPLRAIFEALGARVYYDDATKLITAKRNLTTIELTVGSDKLYINGEETIIDVPAFVQNGRTLVPVRAVSEALGVSVDWDEETPCVIINSLFWEHYVTISSITENYVDNGKNVNIECYYPQLRSKKAEIIKFNQLLKTEAENYVLNVKREVNNYDEDNLNFTRDYNITYDYSNYFSYIVQDTVNGADVLQSSFNINIGTLKNIELSEFETTDIYGNSLDYVTVFTNYINNNPEYFYDNAIEIINNDSSIFDYYLTFKGFNYYVNPGIISAYENGIISLEIEN